MNTRTLLLAVAGLCLAMLGTRSQAAMHVIALPVAAEARGLDVRVGDVLSAPEGEPELDGWRWLKLEHEDAMRSEVALVRQRAGQRQALRLPPGRWDLSVLPTTIAWSEGVAWDPRQSLSTTGTVGGHDTAFAWIAQGRQQSRQRAFGDAARSFDLAREAATGFEPWVDLIQTLAFESHPDRAQSLAAAERAVVALRAYPRSPLLLASALNQAAVFRFQKRDQAGAERAAVEALSLAPQTLLAAQAHVLIATLAMRVGQHDKAGVELAQAEEIVQRIAPDGIDAALLHARRATLLQMRREGEAASQAHREALARLRQLLPDSLQLGKMSFNAHLHALERRRYAEAEGYARDAMLAFSTASPNSLEYFQASSALGEVLMRRGEYEEADALMMQASTASAALSPFGYESLSLRLQLGESRLRQQQPEVALAYFDAVATNLSAPEGEPLRIGSNLAADTQMYRAKALADLDRCALAIEAAHAALAAYLGRAPGGAHVFSTHVLLSDCQRRIGGLSIAEQHARQALVGYRSMHADGLQLAQAHFALARVQREMREIETALQSYMSAIDEFERHRQFVGGDDQIRTLWASQYQEFYKEPMLLLATLDRAAELDRLDQRYRTQSLLKLLGAGDSDLSRDWIGRLSELLPLSTLAEDQAMIGYAVASQHTIVLIKAPAQAVRVVVLPMERDQLQRDVDRLLLLSSRVSADPRGGAALDGLAAGLYKQLVAPIADSVQDYPNWVIVADGPLLSLPWASLLVATEPRRYLIEDRVIATAPSAAVWGLLSAYATRSRQVLAFSDPRLATVVGARQKGNELAALPGARAEADALLALYSEQAQGYVGAEARESRVRTLAPSAGLVHFALHSVIDAREPLASHILLAKGEAGDPNDDGKLRADEIARDLKLQADLVVLSSCASARGRDGGGEGLLGLTSALHLAGARAVIGTRWPIADSPTSSLMQTFHRHLHAGADSATALAIAQRSWLQRARDRSWLTSIYRWIGLQEAIPEFADSPFYWAGFEHSGAGTARHGLTREDSI